MHLVVAWFWMWQAEPRSYFSLSSHMGLESSLFPFAGLQRILKSESAAEKAGVAQWLQAQMSFALCPEGIILFFFLGALTATAPSR